MRVASGVAAAAVVVGIMTVGLLAGPAVKASAAQASAHKAPAAPVGVRSRLAELADAATGADLWSRSSVSERPMGSVTKVMTAYVVLTTPKLDLNRVLTVPAGITAYDTKYDASTAGLRPGERLTTRQLLYALLLPSGCDAAYTLAAAYGPGRGGFITRMNATAKKLGMAKTHFSDFSGLPDPGEYSTYSTAHDLIGLGRAAMRLNTLAAVVATRSYRVASGDGHRVHSWTNLDPLLGRFPGAIGIKSGYTAAAGQCLLFEARRGSRTLIGVVLDSSPVASATDSAAAADATAMLAWGFAQRTIRRA